MKKGFVSACRDAEIVNLTFHDLRHTWSSRVGHEKGAFTDAKSRKAGLLEQANCKGTVFLDEISELDINLQAKLLRVLEEGGCATG